MLVKRLIVEKLRSPYREILRREVEKLKKRNDILAIGLAGSVSREDFWPGADLDIEVIVKGDKPKRVVCTEQEISVDYGYFGEPYIHDLPHDTRPIYDPAKIMTKALRHRTKKQLWQKMIEKNITSTEKHIQMAKSALQRDPYSASCHIHNAGADLGSNLILIADMAPSVRRTVSKLETAMKKIHRLDLFDRYLSLYGMPETLKMSDFLLEQLEQGYKEVWSYMNEKSVGPAYMVQQTSSEPWFRNRIKPIYEHDKRDLVWIVFVEYNFILGFILKAIGTSDFPDTVFEKLKLLSSPPFLWVNRYRRILSLIPEKDVPNLVSTAEELQVELKRLANERYLK